MFNSPHSAVTWLTNQTERFGDLGRAAPEAPVVGARLARGRPAPWSPGDEPTRRAATRPAAWG